MPPAIRRGFAGERAQRERYLSCFCFKKQDNLQFLRSMNKLVRIVVVLHEIESALRLCGLCERKVVSSGSRILHQDRPPNYAG